MKLNRKHLAAAAAVVAVCVAAPVTAQAVTAPSPVHHAAFFACVDHNGAGQATAVTGHTMSCPAGSILAEGDKGTGAAGPAGPAGAAGKDGAPGTVGDVLHNSSAAVIIPAGGEVQAYATCAADATHGLAPNGDAAGYVAVGGGYVADGGSTGADKVTVTIDRDELTNTAGRGWLVQARNDDTVSHTVASWVICISAPADNPNT